MAGIRVNPTRMELLRLKRRLVVARRGHKLLKDKRDELMKRFLDVVRENRTRRELMERQLAAAHRGFVLARAVMRPEAIESALMLGSPPLLIDIDTVNVMSVEVPVFLPDPEQGSRNDVPPYGLASTSGELDDAILALRKAFEGMLSLAEAEKAAQLLADEIERTRRRVNSLEYILIPSLAETIHSITAKLEENERGARTRLMKVKDRLVERAVADRAERERLAGMVS